MTRPGALTPSTRRSAEGGSVTLKAAEAIVLFVSALPRSSITWFAPSVTTIR